MKERKKAGGVGVVLGKNEKTQEGCVEERYEYVYCLPHISIKYNQV